MAEYKLVNSEQLDTDLSSVADCIRSKTGKVGALTFPEGFISSLDTISDSTGSYIDVSTITDFQYFCFNNRFVESLDSFDTSSGINFKYMFSGCTNLITTPQLDTSNGTDFSGMFSGCRNLTTVSQFDISKGTAFGSMFYTCKALKTVELAKATTDLEVSTFSYCDALENLTIGEGWAVSIYLPDSPNLTQESLHGMIENLADLTGLTAKTFQIGSTNLAKVDEEHVAMLESKNWIYS